MQGFEPVPEISVLWVGDEDGDFPIKHHIEFLTQTAYILFYMEPMMLFN